MTTKPTILTAPPDGWFDPGTVVTLIDDYGPYGLFSGTKDGHPDEETCPWDEFGFPTNTTP